MLPGLVRGCLREPLQLDRDSDPPKALVGGDDVIAPRDQFFVQHWHAFDVGRLVEEETKTFFCFPGLAGHNWYTEESTVLLEGEEEVGVLALRDVSGPALLLLHVLPVLPGGAWMVPPQRSLVVVVAIMRQGGSTHTKGHR